MDQSRMDGLTRFVARHTGRRSFVSGALGGLLASLATIPSRPAAEARKKATCKKPRRRCGNKCVNVMTSRRHCGRCGRTCRPGYACRRGKCTPLTPPCGQGGPCRVFVTTSAHQGNLGGLDGADEICNKRAREGGMSGFYKAWLSSAAGGSPASRFTRNSGPYVLKNGTRIANSWTDLTDGSLLAPINIMENGQLETGIQFAWTGTATSGQLHGGPTCTNWTTNSSSVDGVQGASNRDDQQWTSWTLFFNCSNAYRLYCFQQS